MMRGLISSYGISCVQNKNCTSYLNGKNRIWRAERFWPQRNDKGSMF